MSISQKNDLRQIMKKRRLSLFEKNPDAGEKIKEHFFNFFQFPFQTIIGGYWPKESELDIKPLLHELHKKGFKCALPCLQESEMVFREWNPTLPLVEGKFHIFEPPATSPLLTPDVLLVPLLAFDKQGNRLGYGKGCYDQYLHKHKPLTIGIGFKGQKVDHVPHDPLDILLDYVLTERGVLNPKISAELNSGF